MRLAVLACNTTEASFVPGRSFGSEMHRTCTSNGVHDRAQTHDRRNRPLATSDQNHVRSGNGGKSLTPEARTRRGMRTHWHRHKYKQTRAHAHNSVRARAQAQGLPTIIPPD
uniref:Uncharacterized protein n=1 Tax=Eutreptiella gymnastica TaxID=73025 RepID=A0A6T2AKC2_9EUGL